MWVFSQDRSSLIKADRFLLEGNKIYANEMIIGKYGSEGVAKRVFEGLANRVSLDKAYYMPE